jgi:hypothetical protein
LNSGKQPGANVALAMYRDGNSFAVLDHDVMTSMDAIKRPSVFF